MTDPTSLDRILYRAATGLSVGGSLALLLFFLFLFGLITAFAKAVRLLTGGRLEAQAAEGDARAADLLRQLSPGADLKGQIEIAQILVGALYFLWAAADTLPKLIDLTGVGPGLAAWGTGGD